jgi:hypothetical protein
MMALNSKTWYFDALIKRKKYCFMAMVFGMNATEAKIKFINQINLQNKENNDILSSFKYCNYIYIYHVYALIKNGFKKTII